MTIPKLPYELQTVISAWGELNPRQQDILIQRYHMQKTLEQVSKKYNISRERVRQLEEKALNKLHTNLESHDQA